MRFGKRVLFAGAGIAVAITLHAELQEWIQHIPGGPLIGVFFRSVPMPGGSVDIRRPPRETIPELTAKIAKTPQDGSLYRLRAAEEELALDFTAAEADWRKLAQLSGDRGPVFELTEYFHRRLQPQDEIAALRTVTQSSADASLPVQEQRQWQAFQRILAVVDEQDMAGAIKAATYRAWIARYPHEKSIREKYIDYLTQAQQYAAAAVQIAAYGKTFSSDTVFLIQARAQLASERGPIDSAIRVYDTAFQALWPSDLDKAYFGLLEREGRLREFLGRARNALQGNPAGFNATARLFHYYQFQNNQVAARRVLVELRLAREARKQPWTADELLTLARLFERVQDLNETARFYYALYSLPGAKPSYTEQALAGLTDLLFTHAGQGLRLGSGDLSLYRDIASVDSSPGFFNGILSLILNSTYPQSSYASEDQKSVAYFQRARAAELLDLFDQRFPRSQKRPALHASLIQTYAAYGDDNAIIQAGRAFMTSFPNVPERETVGLLMADAYARQEKTNEEFAIYDQLVGELAAKAHGLPLGMKGGSSVTETEAPSDRAIPHSRVFLDSSHGGSGYSLVAQTAADVPQGPGPRATNYAATLDRYLSRLVAINRPLDALRVYRREIDRNPNDPGLYERLAGFLEQNGAGQDVESTYRRAIAKFPDHTWSHRLARWYLRQKQTAAFETLTREITGIFSGTALEQYFEEVVVPGALDPVLYLQLNVYAHQRFPEDLAFVHNLLNAYSHPETSDTAAANHLLRQYWFYEPALRNRLFEQLSSLGQLNNEVAAVQKQSNGANPAAVQFIAEADAWLSHFESAAPEMRSLAEQFPGCEPLSSRASAVYRSLAAYDPANTSTAASLAEAEYKYNPRNRDFLAKIGDIYADRERFDRARQYWNRMPRVEPGKTDGYLESATVFWDYYFYDDALRIIQKARSDFNDPTLFAFQASAIYENKRDFPRAVEQYVAGALAGDMRAEQRLLRLAKRPNTGDLVERFSAEAVSKAALSNNDGHEAAVRLRAAVLDARDRRQDLETFLLSEVANTRKVADLVAIGELAGATYNNLPTVQTRALERRVALTTDPVEKMRLRINLVKLLEQTKDVASAARVTDDLYRENPLILGVVRASVDFHVRNKQPDRAITTLLEAASHARQDLANQFTLEAANVATSAGDFDHARTLLEGLLKTDPYGGDYQASMAATYSKAGDDRGLREYQLASIEALKNAPIPAAERTERIAGLRRTLIPSLTRLNDFSGAVQQYIEVLNRYPEDDTLAREALLYATAHNRTAQLLDFYKKTVAEAPRDYRWPILLGRLETYAEDYPAAIASYDLAMKARPDRSDVVEARAQLEERLMRFAEAIRSYSRLYELSYHNAQWMVKIAELHARENQPDQAVAALKTTIIGAHSETAQADLEIAGKLESWNLVSQALGFAERAAQLAGPDITKRGSMDVYARVMTRARKIEPVLNLVLADETTRYVIPEIGALIATYYTPEEKSRLERTLVDREAKGRPDAEGTVFIPLATAAGLTGIEAQWRLDLMSKSLDKLDSGLIKLQSERANYEELGRQLESYTAASQHAQVVSAALNEAANAYISAGDAAGELRVMRILRDRSELGGALLDRYLATIAALHHEELFDIIRGSSSNEIRNRAVQFAIASESEPVALRAVETRGAGMPPVWAKSYTALTGLYYADRSPSIAAAFLSALDTRSIGDRIKAPLDRAQQLAGKPWFYYGARYGEYMDLMKRSAARDFLPSLVEESPGNPDAYLALGDYYAGAGDASRATAQFKSVLQLDADRGDAHNHLARLLWSQGQRDEALTRWRSALAAYLHQESKGGPVPEPFWYRTIETIGDIGRAHALADLRPDIERLLRDYINRNGSYRSFELIAAAFHASIHLGIDPKWIVDMVASTGEGGSVLFQLMNLPEVSLAQKIQIQRVRIAMARPTETSGPLVNEYVKLITLLLDSGDVKAAEVAWAQIPDREQTDQTARQIYIRLAGANGTLAQALENWRWDDGGSVEALRGAATILRANNNKDAALSVLEFLYLHELGQGKLDAANFLGLAEVRLERSDVEGAVAQLRRMVLVTTDPFDTLMPAAELLARFGKNPQAADFLRQRVRAVPWDAAAKLRLVSLDPNQDRGAIPIAIAIDSRAPYETRVEAARMLAPQTIPALADTELGLLSGSRILPANAAKPYYVYARLAAAEDMSDAAARLTVLRQALAIAPGNPDVRLATLRAALDSKRDSLSLAINTSAGGQPGQFNLSDAERAKIAERLAEAAKRLDDLTLTQQLLHLAIDLHAENEREALRSKLKAIEAEQSRRASNAARQPVIKNAVDQVAVVRPYIVRSAQ